MSKKPMSFPPIVNVATLISLAILGTSVDFTQSVLAPEQATQLNARLLGAVPSNTTFTTSG